jgi:hypothetical protein
VFHVLLHPRDRTLWQGLQVPRLLTAWMARENLRILLALARSGADRHRIGRARWKFLT